MKVHYEHHDGYQYDKIVADFAAARKAIADERDATFEYIAPEYISDVFPIRYDIEGEIPEGESSFGYINELGEIF